MKLSSNFTLEEFLVSETAERRGIDNYPPPDVIANLARTAEVLEMVRIKLEHAPVIITSGYRSPALNAVVGGAANSSHLKGLAVDFIAPRYGTPLQCAVALSMCDGLMEEVDQLIHEFGHWVHLGLPGLGAARRELLTIDRTGTSHGLQSVA